MGDERLYIRVTPAMRDRLTQGAIAAGCSLNQYVNKLLEKEDSQDEFKGLVIELLHDITDLIESKNNNENSSSMIETLLYLRLLSTPEQRNKVNAELARLGYSPMGVEHE
ncbi:toxin-antitoxin system HicB family antitoxin [Cronobacter sakazakii]|nr:toxin-antitoxin system HicB family antitoxin [Cronobacter sakazakii]